MRLSALSSTLEALSPLKTLAKGYALVCTENKVVNSVTLLNVGDEIELRLNDGDLKCCITQIEKRMNREDLR